MLPPPPPSASCVETAADDVAVDVDDVDDVDHIDVAVTVDVVADDTFVVDTCVPAVASAA